jgi:hypothetical protein
VVGRYERRLVLEAELRAADVRAEATIETLDEVAETTAVLVAAGWSIVSSRAHD